MANKWVQKLQKMNGVVTEAKDRFSKPLKTFSPSVNFIYGRTHGLPFGFTSVLYGPPKGGKSVLLHMMIGWLHQTDPDAIAIKIDTEFRNDGQLDAAAMQLYGIDPDRLIVMQTNVPSEIFDQIEKDIAAMCQQGAPIKLIGIDSVSGIQGRREMTSESVEKQTIGDHAQTIQIGLKRILPVIRKYDIALALVTQVRAEMDMTEQMRGNKFKMQASYGLQHMAEYFVAVEPNLTIKGRKDELGNEFVNEGVKDLAEKGEVTAMKIRVKMKNSSMGPKGRTGEFTFDFHHGLINTHEEVFRLGTNYNIIVPGDKSGLVFGDSTWRGKEACLKALKEDANVCDAIVAELQRRDLAGDFSERDAAAEREESTD
jgi:RecA/RadA recombinase